LKAGYFQQPDVKPYHARSVYFLWILVKRKTGWEVTALILVVLAVAYAAIYINENSQKTFASLVNNGTSYIILGHQQSLVARVNVTSSKAYLNGGFEGNGSWYLVVIAESDYANFTANPSLAVSTAKNVWDLQLVDWRPNFNTSVSDQLLQGVYYVVVYNPNNNQVTVNTTRDLLLQSRGLGQP
jgi:hypothetical protein